MIERRPSLSLPILRAARAQDRAGTLAVGTLLSALGERSFGWAIVVFSLVTLLPLPPGSSLITGLPLLLATAQMMLGFPHVRMPGFLSRMKLNHVKLRRTLLKLRPVTRRLERVLHPRYERLFSSRYERPLGLVLFIIAFALFLPVPFSGWFPAVSLFAVGVGLIERDGLIVTVGLGMGLTAVLLTAAIAISLTNSAEAIIN